MPQKILFCIPIILFFACNPAQPGSNQSPLSKSQTFLDSLAKSYEADYAAAPEVKKAEIKQNYFNLLQYGLTNNGLDSIHVTVDEVGI